MTGLSVSFDPMTRTTPAKQNAIGAVNDHTNPGSVANDEEYQDWLLDLDCMGIHASPQEYEAMLARCPNPAGEGAVALASYIMGQRASLVENGLLTFGAV